MAENIATLLDKNHFELTSMARKSAVWFEQQAFNLIGADSLTPAEALRGDQRKLKNNIIPGSMYFFMYDAKLKDKLPYYDMFPMVLPFALTDNGFIGLNLHYLPYDMRIRLLSKLQEFSNSKTLSPQAKLKFSWEMLSGLSKYKPAAPCVKRYLASNIHSQFRLVPPNDWATACMLPLERFAGSTKFQVWSDSIRKIK